MNINIATVQFPEIHLQTREAHKLRGYFGNLFKEHSPVLHNHYETGELRYKYPLVQYKIIKEIPTLVALQEGAALLTSLFLKMNKLELGSHTYEIISKNIESRQYEVGYSDKLHQYGFQTLWMALNQANHMQYIDATTEEKQTMLDKILVGNILSFFKGIDLRLEPGQRLMAKAKVKEKSTKFKDRHMIAFEGEFLVNASLPINIGLGKAVSRGFGSIL